MNLNQKLKLAECLAWAAIIFSLLYIVAFVVDMKARIIRLEKAVLISK